MALIRVNIHIQAGMPISSMMRPYCSHMGNNGRGLLENDMVEFTVFPYLSAQQLVLGIYLAVFLIQLMQGGVITNDAPP
jgi:hypothetical protein